MRRIYTLSIVLAALFVFEACTTGKKAYEKGNYYQSVIQSVDKLRKNPKNKKASAALADAYPLAIQTIDLNTQNMLKSNDPAKWKTVLANYEKVNRMYEEILRSPAALKIVPQPKNYYAELEQAKQNAALEVYDRAMSFLMKGTREDAKIAYRLFRESQGYVANFKDTNERMEEARMAATLFVMVNQDPVPEKFAVSGNHFRNKIDEFLHSSEARMEFIEFYNPKEMIELGIQPDHEIVLRYQEFNIGNVFQKESTHHLIKDSVVVATYERDIPASAVSGSTTTQKSVSTTGATQDAKTKEGGTTTDEKQKVIICHKIDENNSQTIEISVASLQYHLDHGDTMGACNSSGGEGNTGNTGSTGNTGNTGNTGTGGSTGSTGNLDNTGTQGSTTTPGKETVNVYATVKATLVVNEKTVTSTASLAMTIYETNRAGRVLRQDMVPVEHVWKSEWGYFNGDERALTPEQLQITKNKELPPPDRDEMFNMLAEQFYYRVTQNIQAFYKDY